MLLKTPFIIGPRLLPALPLADGLLSLESTSRAEEGRVLAHFILDRPGQPAYRDSNLRSGMGGFRSTVEPFEAMLAFMEAAIDDLRHEMYSGRPSGEKPLFPGEIAEWLYENSDAVEMARCDLCDETGAVRHNLIEA